MQSEILSKYYQGNNFWKVCPEFRIMEVFESFHNSDKSKDKTFSSSILWAISFCLRRESLMYNLPDKWELAAKDIVKNKTLNWDDYDHIIDAFKATQMSQAERSLLAWEELMAKRDKYLKNQEYYFDEYLRDENDDNVVSRTGQFITVKGTADQLDKAFSATPKMFNDFLKIKIQIDEEDIVKKGRGNKNLSISETGEI